jgi:hypothetical protein
MYLVAQEIKTFLRNFGLVGLVDESMLEDLVSVLHEVLHNHALVADVVHVIGTGLGKRTG